MLNLFQNIHTGGVTGLGLLPALQLHMLEQNDTKLFRRVDIELLPGFFINQFPEFLNTPDQLIPIFL